MNDFLKIMKKEEQEAEERLRLANKKDKSSKKPSYYEPINFNNSHSIYNNSHSIGGVQTGQNMLGSGLIGSSSFSSGNISFN